MRCFAAMCFFTVLSATFVYSVMHADGRDFLFPLSMLIAPSRPDIVTGITTI
jgi:hypothetical protein